jgi:hypothetical protein
MIDSVKDPVEMEGISDSATREDVIDVLVSVYEALSERHQESAKKMEDNEFEGGRFEAIWEALDIINSRLDIMNAMYEDDDEDEEEAAS